MSYKLNSVNSIVNSNKVSRIRIRGKNIIMILIVMRYTVSPTPDDAENSN